MSHAIENDALDNAVANAEPYDVIECKNVNELVIETVLYTGKVWDCIVYLSYIADVDLENFQRTVKDNITYRIKDAIEFPRY